MQLFSSFKLPIVVAVIFCATPANSEPGDRPPAMTFTSGLGDPTHIIATGEIVHDTPELFEALMASMRGERRVTKQSIVELSSPGGNIAAAMALGRDFRMNGYSTSVGQGQLCASACAFAFMGGVARFVSGNGRVGVHQFALQPEAERPDKPQYTGRDILIQDTVGQLLEYCKEMGVGADIVAIASRTLPYEVHWLSPREMKSSEFAETAGDVPLQSEQRLQSRPREAAEPTAPDSTRLFARAAMLIAVAGDPKNPTISLGSVVWSTIPSVPGQPATVGVKADVDVPDLKLHATMTLHKSGDPALPASHTMELRVSFADGAEIKGIEDIGLPQLRQSDSPRTESMIGIRVKLNDKDFIVGLNRGDADVARNLDLMTRYSWFDFPLRLNDGRFAKLMFEKSSDGSKLFESAFAAWK